MSTYQHITQRTDQMPVRQLCQAFRVVPAAYYTWYRREQELSGAGGRTGLASRGTWGG